jgi:hypothetical protein
VGPDGPCREPEEGHAHVIETAPTGRAKCRGCGGKVAAAELRFGERLPNPFADGEMTRWYHLACEAFKRPEPFLEALAAREELLDDREWLESEAKRGVAHRRLPRIDGAERTPTGPGSIARFAQRTVAIEQTDF